MHLKSLQRLDTPSVIVPEKRPEMSQFQEPSRLLKSELTPEQLSMVAKVIDFTEGYFDSPKFDASHDFAHVMRVVRTSFWILQRERLRQEKRYDSLTVALGALLHDVDDHKYVQPEPAKGSVRAALKSFGAPFDLIERVLCLVSAVSYSTECKDPQSVEETIKAIPETAIVQDADRLDALGAIGIGRTFTYNAAKGNKDLGTPIKHCEEKLLKLADMMKTRTGKEEATTRTRRVRRFMDWWSEEEENFTTVFGLDRNVTVGQLEYSMEQSEENRGERSRKDNQIGEGEKRGDKDKELNEKNEKHGEQYKVQDRNDEHLDEKIEKLEEKA